MVKKQKPKARRPKARKPKATRVRSRPAASKAKTRKLLAARKRPLGPGRRKRAKPVIERVSPTRGGTGWVHEEVYYPRERFKKKAMITAKGGRSTFTSRSFVDKRSGKRVWLIFGCLKGDYDRKSKTCKGTTLHKKIKQITAEQAVRMRAANPQLLVISNPCPEAAQYVVKGKRSNVRKPITGFLAKRNPKNVTNRDVQRGRKAYKRFHFTQPAMETRERVPDGLEDAYVVIGELERFDVRDGAGKLVSKRFNSSRPRLCTNAAMKDLYIFGKGRKLGIPVGNAERCDYRVPAHSGRTKWARRWWHPHDTLPAVAPHRGGRVVKVSGHGLSVTPRGIEG